MNHPVKQIIDPICGLTVDQSTEFRAHLDGMTVYFCSDRCRDKFLSAPETERAGMMLADTDVHTCPRHPEVWQLNPDDCPKCRAETESEGATAATGDKCCPESHGGIGSLRLAVTELRCSWADSRAPRWMRSRQLFGNG